MSVLVEVQRQQGCAGGAVRLDDDVGGGGLVLVVDCDCPQKSRSPEGERLGVDSGAVGAYGNQSNGALANDLIAFLPSVYRGRAESRGAERPPTSYGRLGTAHTTAPSTRASSAASSSGSKSIPFLSRNHPINPTTAAATAFPYLIAQARVSWQKAKGAGTPRARRSSMRMATLFFLK